MGMVKIQPLKVCPCIVSYAIAQGLLQGRCVQLSRNKSASFGLGKLFPCNFSLVRKSRAYTQHILTILTAVFLNTHSNNNRFSELEELAAQMFGMEAALYFPSGVMGNLASVMSHCWERGQEVLLGDLSHIHLYEQGGISQLAGVHARTVVNRPNGTFDIDEMQTKIRPYFDVHQPRTALVCLENTHNRCSGAVLPLDFIAQVSGVVKQNSLKLHVDGARVFNAATALGVPVVKVLDQVDSVSVCLSKGLGCPVGTIVSGSKDFIKRAHRCRKVLGGAMRQSGVVAATGIVALKTMVGRLADDHTHAQMIAQAISACKSEVATVDLKAINTNMVMVEINPKYMTVGQFCDRLRQVTEEEKVDMIDELCVLRVNPFGPKHARIVTHADVSYDDTVAAIKKLKYVIGGLDNHCCPSSMSGNGNSNSSLSSNSSDSLNGSYA